MHCMIHSQEEVFFKFGIECLLLSLCLLLGRGGVVGEHPQLDVGVRQTVGVHGGKIQTLMDWGGGGGGGG